jgi:hypothetical protein
MEKELKQAMIVLDMKAELEKDIEFFPMVMSAALEGLELYRKNMTNRNANIDLIVRNLKPEHYEEISKYVIPEVFESLGMQDAIKVIHS